MNQKVFDVQVTNVLVQRCPEIDPDALAFVFDVLYVSDEMLDEVLGKQSNLS